MIEFLLIAGLAWLVVASVFDIKKREIPNWLSFSLIAVALVYRLIVSVLNNDYMFFLNGLIGLGIFVGLGYGFYYARIFAGGDAKLLMGLGAILSFSGFWNNLFIMAGFLFLLLFSGAIYGLIFSFILAAKNKKKFTAEFKKQGKKYKSFFYISFVFAFLALLLVLYINDFILFAFPVLILAFPLLFVYGKAIEEACMIKEIKAEKVTVGDWLYKKVKIGKNIIKPNWEGLSEKEVRLLRKYKKKVLIKTGIPFVPVFLIAYLALLILWYFGFLKIFQF